MKVPRNVTLYRPKGTKEYEETIEALQRMFENEENFVLFFHGGEGHEMAFVDHVLHWLALKFDEVKWISVDLGQMTPVVLDGRHVLAGREPLIFIKRDYLYLVGGGKGKSHKIEIEKSHMRSQMAHHRDGLYKAISHFFKKKT